MAMKCVRYEQKNATALITLDRPRVLNAMNHRMWIDLQAALDRAQPDPGVKVVVITGEGRAFSSGADLKESRERSAEDYRAYLEEVQAASRRIIRFPKPTIAAINGYALGSGYELALACDLRLAAEDAVIGSPEAKVSSSVTGGAFRLIQQLIGPGKASELLFTAENIDGREAERIGLVNRAVAPDKLMPTALAMAEQIGANAALSLKLIKKGLRMARGPVRLEALMDFEIEACLACVSTAERHRALDDFADRKQSEED
ncbi:MAG: enoyl-CoA hydratase/isomerase family protein [Desulfobacterales bacterium]|nr:enoyl-CoA hydratase/isomerase family protein [Desulfobacterales bacterium]